MGGPVVKPLATRAMGPGFDSPITQHVQRLISRAFTYGSVGSLVLSWFWARNLDSFPSGAFGFNCVISLGKGYVCTGFNCVITFGNGIMCVQACLAHQAIHPFRVGKLVRAINQ